MMGDRGIHLTSDERKRLIEALLANKEVKRQIEERKQQRRLQRADSIIIDIDDLD